MKTPNKPLKDRVLLRTKLSKKEVFLRADFDDLGGYDQVGRALRLLIADGKLVKLGQGLYAPARTSSISNKVVLAVSGGFKRAVQIALERLQVRFDASSAVKDYNSGRTTQIPAGVEFIVPRNFSRKIEFNGMKANLVWSSFSS